jgi:hypothetical protein
MELSALRESQGVREDGNLGMAMLFERRGRDRGASSAATEARKTIGVRRRRKNRLKQEKRRVHLTYSW